MTNNFDKALQDLISTLRDGKYSENKEINEFCTNALQEWDKTRGTDWYAVSTASLTN